MVCLVLTVAEANASGYFARLNYLPEQAKASELSCLPLMDFPIP